MRLAVPCAGKSVCSSGTLRAELQRHLHQKGIDLNVTAPEGGFRVQGPAFTLLTKMLSAAGVHLIPPGMYQGHSRILQTGLPVRPVLSLLISIKQVAHSLAFAEGRCVLHHQTQIVGDCSESMSSCSGNTVPLHGTRDAGVLPQKPTLNSLHGHSSDSPYPPVQKRDNRAPALRGNPCSQSAKETV